MLRLGNIGYSNCYPIHGPVLERHRPAWLQVVDGPPSELNRLLAAGKLDIAPGSSIELARHDREYSAMRGLCIGSLGPVESIVVASRVPLDELGGRTVALPTASATSRVLLRILLELRHGIRPRWVDFDQSTSDSLTTSLPSRAEWIERGTPPDAALYIGDVALRLPTQAGELRFDLGLEWTRWTGLPFVYAVWLMRNEVVEDDEAQELHRLFLACRDDLPAAFGRLAAMASDRFGFPAQRLVHYWSHIHYQLDAAMLRGLEHFLHLAAELGEAPQHPDLRFPP